MWIVNTSKTSDQNQSVKYPLGGTHKKDNYTLLRQGRRNNVTDRSKQEWIWCSNSTERKANLVLQRVRIWNVSTRQQWVSVPIP